MCRKEELDWSQPHKVFPLLIQALPLPSYRRAVMEGLVSSLGGLTGALVSVGTCEWILSCVSVCVCVCVCLIVFVSLHTGANRALVYVHVRVYAVYARSCWSILCMYISAFVCVTISASASACVSGVRGRACVFYDLECCFVCVGHRVKSLSRISTSTCVGWSSLALPGR